jgi:uncharacterized flavoprotein (TIGR03862 family)
MEVKRSLRAAVVGGGPAGLMAAETLRGGGCEVDLYERMGSVGRKFLVAGKGGLNLTHSEGTDAFVARYGRRSGEVGRWLAAFGAADLRAWARGLGVETFVGTSGRVFPRDLKAAPLLRGWVRRLRADGVRFHVHHAWQGWMPDGALRFAAPDGDLRVEADVAVLATGGGSWPVLGSDGQWVPLLASRGVDVAPLAPANCGFDVDWSARFRERHAGDPVKPVVLEWMDEDGARVRRQGELVVSAHGIEGSLVYAASAALREAIARRGDVEVRLDLAPGRTRERLARELARRRGSRSLSEHWRRSAGLARVQAGLVREALAPAMLQDAQRVADAVKSLPLVLRRPRPLSEAISSAGGVRFEALDGSGMLRACPGVFCAGEMIDWEAPTGGYLLTACFASGRAAAEGALRWAERSAPPA